MTLALIRKHFFVSPALRAGLTLELIGPAVSLARVVFHKKT
jgi:hypothetical protein